MEDFLSQVITAAASNNFSVVKKSALDALEFLALQQGLIRDPAHELREKCIKVIQLCLETRRSKFVSLAILGCHRLLRDDRFHSNFELEDDTKWLLGQLLQATSSFTTQTEDTQVDILKVFLNVACGNVWNMNGRLIIAVLSLCSEAFDSGNAAVRTAAQAAASQSLRSFISQLEEETKPEDTEAVAFNEIIPILQFLCSRIDSSECSGRCEHGMLFLLECLLTVLSSLPSTVHVNIHLRQLLWQKLAPALISVLGTPKVDKHITSRGDSDVGREKGRGSGCLAAAPTFSALHARAVYSAIIELVRLVGPMASLRPMLESLFHRMLLYPAPLHRLDALKATGELLRSPLRLLDIAGPLAQTDSHPCDMALVRLIMDSIEECRKGDVALLAAAVACSTALLDALLELCKGSCLPATAVDEIVRLWPKLHECEYSGPTCYQSGERLPQSYQHRIQMEKDNEKDGAGEESDSSGIGQKSDCSGDTEGPESLEAEVDCKACETDPGDGVPGLSLGIIDLPIGLGDNERQHARHFIGALHDLLSTLQPMWGSAQLDQALQTFASQYCQGVVREQPITEWGIIINADGIYLTTLSALLLDLRLNRAGYYSEPGQAPLLTEDEFVEEVQGSGVLVYLSGTWLREVYQSVVSGSLLRAHGFFLSDINNHSLINLLIDLGGLGTRQQGSEMLWERRRLEVAANASVPSPEVAAGVRLARLLLTCCWSSLLWVLATPLSLKPARGKRRQQMLRDTVACSLQGLQSAAKLCSILGVQDRCDLILEQLSAASCAAAAPRRLLSSRDALPRLTVSAALSLELILQQGLELGSHCSACWPHVFRTVRAVRRLEKAAFKSAAALDVAVSPTGVLGQDTASQDDDEVDVYSFLRSSNGELMVTKYLKNVGYVDVLSASQTANVLTLLSYMSVELIMEAAYKLNLRALESFTRALCAASRVQLFPPPQKRELTTPPHWIQKLLPHEAAVNEPYLLDSVGELMVKCIRSSRPLAHVMRVWRVVGPHLTEAACHEDTVVSKKAVELIETIINTHIKQTAELPYFHFNEALFKPFENLLCLELCSTEIQDQIVSCICEFVEGSASDVQSGWRALFGALRSVPSSATFLDVFQLFLDTKNPLVFCSAAVDCILCLLKHIRSSSPTKRNSCLQFLQRCEDVLAALWAMPQPLVFQAAHRIHISDSLLVEQPDHSSLLVPFEAIPQDLLNMLSFSYPELAVSHTDTNLTLEVLDRPSGVLRVWFLLLEGLYSAAVAADSDAQPPLLDAFFADIMSLTQRPEPKFGIFCINRLILPATQTWLRPILRMDLSGPKQALGLLSELVLACVRQHHSTRELQVELTLMLKQLMLVLLECAPHPQTASTPPSCFKHIVMNVGFYFIPAQWRVTVLALRRSIELTLVPLRQILMAFTHGSQSFYGDYDQVKVAARKNCTLRDVIHLKLLAQQVFLLDCQREELKPPAETSDPPEERSYTLLLRPVLDPSSGEVVRVPVKSLTMALLAHHTLLQVLAGILLQGSSFSISSLDNILTCSKADPPSQLSLPGMMHYIPAVDILVLLDCLDLSYTAALQFDARPGLKFLIQKIFALERAANLYRQVGAAWAIKVVALFELCLYHVKKRNLTAEDLKNLQHSVTQSDLKIFVVRLQENFEDLCDTYIDLILDLDGTYSAVDKAPDQPILFLNACQDDEISPIQPRKSVGDGGLLLDQTTMKPFLFADFACTISASSTSDSEPEYCKSEEEEGDAEVGKDQESLASCEMSQAKGEESVKLGFEKASCQSVRKCNESEIEYGAVDKTAIKNSEKENVDKNYESQVDNVVTEIEIKDVSEENADDNVDSQHEFNSDKHVDYEDERDMQKPCEPMETVFVLNKVAIATAENFESFNYQIADKKTALDEYKKSKLKHAPQQKRNNPFIAQVPASSQQPPIPPEIEVQRRNSFLKDSEAHLRVWAEMLGVVLELLSQLTDEDFLIMLPLLFGGIRRLTAHATDPSLKQALANFFTRVAMVYGFGSP